MGTGYDMVEKTPEWAAPICGISADRIKELAAEIGDDPLARCETVEAAIGLRRRLADAALGVEHQAPPHPSDAPQRARLMRHHVARANPLR